MYEFTIPGRPATKKNSRVHIGGGATIPSKAYRDWAKSATVELKRQWPGEEKLEGGPWHLEVITYRKNRQWVNDVDAPLTSVMDVLKGTVFEDDSPTYIGSAFTDMVFDWHTDEVRIRLTPHLRAIYSTPDASQTEMLAE